MERHVSFVTANENIAYEEEEEEEEEHKKPVIRGGSLNGVEGVISRKLSEEQSCEKSEKPSCMTRPFHQMRAKSSPALVQRKHGSQPTDPNSIEMMIKKKEITMAKLYALAHEQGNSTANACGENHDALHSLVKLLSVIYALIVIILSVAFEAARNVNGNTTNPKIQRKITNYEGFYIYLYIVGLGFLCFCKIFLFRSRSWRFRDMTPAKILEKMRQRTIANSAPASPTFNGAGLVLRRAISEDKKATHSARHAGSLYLRLGCVFFGLCGTVYMGLACFDAASKDEVDVLKVTSPILACIFFFVQMEFVFQNSKLTIHGFTKVSRFGTMHLVATNVCVWIRYFLLEVMHTSYEFKKKIEKQEMKFSSFSFNGSKEKTYEDVTGPFGNKNVNCSKATFSLECHVTGMQPFLVTSLVEYSIICAAVMFILWLNVDEKASRTGKYRNEKYRVDCSSSVRGLFMGILIIIFSIFSMVIFYVKMSTENIQNALWLLYSSNMIIYVAAIIATCVGSWRMLKMSYVTFHQGSGVLLLDDILLFIGFIGQLLYCLFVIVLLEVSSPLTIMLEAVSCIRIIQVTTQTAFILSAQRLIALTPWLQKEKPGREMVTFLLVANLALFLTNIFGLHKASVNPIMKEFFGKQFYNVLVHSTVPLNIFFRFHSSVCLCEIWKVSYTERQVDEDSEA